MEIYRTHTPPHTHTPPSALSFFLSLSLSLLSRVALLLLRLSCTSFGTKLISKFSTPPRPKNGKTSTCRVNLKSTYRVNLKSTYRVNLNMPSTYRVNLESMYRVNLKSTYRINLKSTVHRVNFNMPSAYRVNLSTYRGNPRIESILNMRIESIPPCLLRIEGSILTCLLRIESILNPWDSEHKRFSKPGKKNGKTP